MLVEEITKTGYCYRSIFKNGLSEHIQKIFNQGLKTWETNSKVAVVVIWQPRIKNGKVFLDGKVTEHFFVNIESSVCIWYVTWKQNCYFTNLSLLWWRPHFRWLDEQSSLQSISAILKSWSFISLFGNIL